MTFAQLSYDLQNIVLINYDIFMKKFIIGFFLIFAISYFFYFRHTHKPTPYIAVGLWRSILTLSSFLYIFFTPIFILVFDPNIEGYTMMNIVVTLYIMFTILGGIILIINTIWFSPAVILRWGSVDLGIEGTHKVGKKINDLFIGGNNE